MVEAEAVALSAMESLSIRVVPWCGRRIRRYRSAIKGDQNLSSSVSAHFFQGKYFDSSSTATSFLFVTSDATTIVNELEIQHPAAKILVLAARAQQEEIGDGANLTISFAGELLQNAEELIRMGLHPSEIISGYNKATNKTVEILEQLVESGGEIET